MSNNNKNKKQTLKSNLCLDCEFAKRSLYYAQLFHVLKHFYIWTEIAQEGWTCIIEEYIKSIDFLDILWNVSVCNSHKNQNIIFSENSYIADVSYCIPR